MEKTVFYFTHLFASHNERISNKQLLQHKVKHKYIKEKNGYTHSNTYILCVLKPDTET